MRKAVIYLACPMTIGGFSYNTRACLEVANRLMAKGYCPIPPVLTYLWNLYSPKTHEDWLQHDFALIAVCDGVLRLKGESVGADREIEYAKGIGVDTFEHEYDLFRDLSPERE